MLKALPHRVLVRMLPRYGDLESKLNLTLVDKKKHFEGSRRGEIMAVGDRVPELKPGDVVWFIGPQGQSFGKNSAGFNDGTEYRRLRYRDCLAVEEKVAA